MFKNLKRTIILTERSLTNYLVVSAFLICKCHLVQSKIANVNACMGEFVNAPWLMEYSLKEMVIPPVKKSRVNLPLDELPCQVIECQCGHLMRKPSVGHLWKQKETSRGWIQTEVIRESKVMVVVVIGMECHGIRIQAYMMLQLHQLMNQMCMEIMILLMYASLHDEPEYPNPDITNLYPCNTELKHGPH